MAQHDHGDRQADRNGLGARLKVADNKGCIRSDLDDVWRGGMRSCDARVSDGRLDFAEYDLGAVSRRSDVRRQRQSQDVNEDGAQRGLDEIRDC